MRATLVALGKKEKGRRWTGMDRHKQGTTIHLAPPPSAKKCEGREEEISERLSLEENPEKSTRTHQRHSPRHLS